MAVGRVVFLLNLNLVKITLGIVLLIRLLEGEAEIAAYAVRLDSRVGTGFGREDLDDACPEPEVGLTSGTGETSVTLVNALFVLNVQHDL